jgi:hypothetical protein
VRQEEGGWVWGLGFGVESSVFSAQRRRGREERGERRGREEEEDHLHRSRMI